jgi:hypothetical protein
MVDRFIKSLLPLLTCKALLLFLRDVFLFQLEKDVEDRFYYCYLAP